MRLFRLFFALFVASATAMPRLGFAAPVRVVVHMLEASGELGPLASKLSDELVTHLGKQKGLVVISRSELDILFGHVQDKEALGDCRGSESCLAKLSRAVDAEKMITGHVGKLGDSYLVSLKLSDVSRAIVERAESISALSEVELAEKVRTMGGVMVGGAPAGEEKPAFRIDVAPAGAKIAVLDLEAAQVDPGVAANLTQLLSLELRRFEGLGVVSRAEIFAMLSYEAEKQIATCTNDTQCLLEIGGALGVDYLVAGSVGRLGEDFVISLKLMHMAKAEVVSRASEIFRGREEILPGALRFVTWQLLGKNVEGRGELAVFVNAGAAEMSVDGGAPVRMPLVKPLEGLGAGRRTVSVSAEGYYGLVQNVYVEDGRRAELHFELREVPSPWYTEWWVWAIAGAAVAAGGVGLYWATDSGPTSGGGVITVR